MSYNFKIVFPNTIAGLGNPASTSVRGTVKTDLTEGDPTVYLKSTIDGANGHNIVFRPTSGKIYIKVATTGYYRELIADVVLGQAVLGISDTDIPFGSLSP